MAVMKTRERLLYFQIHPLKLATDVGVQLLSFWLFWLHLLVPALLALSVPELVVSALLLRFADLSGQRDSTLGRSIVRAMTPATQVVRFSGMLPICVGAWLHTWWLAGLGVAVIGAGWLGGLLRKDAQGGHRGHGGTTGAHPT